MYNRSTSPHSVSTLKLLSFEFKVAFSHLFNNFNLMGLIWGRCWGKHTGFAYLSPLKMALDPTHMRKKVSKLHPLPLCLQIFSVFTQFSHLSHWLCLLWLSRILWYISERPAALSAGGLGFRFIGSPKSVTTQTSTSVHHPKFCCYLLPSCFSHIFLFAYF